MAHQKNKNLYIVRDGDYMQGNPYQSGDLQEVEGEIRQHRSKIMRRVFIGIIITAVFCTAAFLYMYLQTYTGVRSAGTYIRYSPECR